MRPYLPLMRPLLSFALLLLGPFTHAQQVVPFDKADPALRGGRLDSLYRSAIHVDSTQAVFQDQQRFIDAYARMLQELGTYLHAHDFEWPGPVRGFNRIYFNADGRVDHFLYSIRPGQISAEQEARFGELLGDFVKDYRFPLPAPERFAQCGSVVYQPKAKEE